MDKHMKARSSPLAVVAMSMMFGVTLTSGAQGRIPELQREIPPLPRAITLTGCVARGAEPGTYTLTHVVKEGELAANEIARPVTVLLSGTVVDLAKYLGQMVTVSGPRPFEGAAIGTTGTGKPAASAARTNGAPLTMPSFTVASLKIVATACSVAT